MDQQTIVQDIARRAKASRVSIAELCRRAGIHQDTFHNWKKTERNPNTTADLPGSPAANTIYLVRA